jgi:hypothetical protein
VPDISRPAPARTGPDAGKFTPASVILQELHDEAPADQFTLDWLMGRLHGHSFGLLMLLLAILAAVPGVCVFAAFLLMILAFQLIVGYPAPVFPRWMAARRLPTRHLGPVVQRAIPVLRYLETVIYPRWPFPPVATRSLVGISVILLSARVILAPFPMTSIPPALVMALTLLAYLEADGLVFSISLAIVLGLLSVDVYLLWKTILGAEWISRLW